MELVNRGLGDVLELHVQLNEALPIPIGFVVEFHRKENIIK